MVRAKTTTSSTETMALDAPPSLIEIKAKLPAHCFRSSALRSLSYLARDLLSAAALHMALEAAWSAGGAWLAALPALWFAQGTIMWALFVIGHDCGHGSFSRYRWLNFAMGVLSHSIIMVPYTPWQLTHRSHHKNTGHIERDEIFMPTRKSNQNAKHDFVLSWGYFAGLGWFIYLLLGYETKGKYGHHFWPYYYATHVGRVCISLAGLAAWTSVLVLYAKTFGALQLGVVYGVPLFVFATWLVVTTFLHHNDDEAGINWYSGADWSYVKGNLSSVDRSCGWLLDELTHNITTHQVHHLFPMVPHYHLKEATVAFRTSFPPLVRQSEKRSLPAFFDQANSYVKRRVIPDDATKVVL